MKKLTNEQLEVLLVRCVGYLEGIGLSKVLPDAAQVRVDKLLSDVYKHTGLKPAPDTGCMKYPSDI